MNIKVLKECETIDTRSNIKTFLKKYSNIIKLFNSNNKNYIIEQELKISRETFNKLQVEMFHNLVRILPEIKPFYENFQLFLNLDNHFEDYWIILVKKCITFFNKDISSTIYVHDNARYIIKKGLYHSNHKLSEIKTLMNKYHKKHETFNIPLEHVSKSLNTSTELLLELLQKPLNEYFYVLNGVIYNYRKNNLKEFLLSYRREKRCTNSSKLYADVNDIYSKKLFENDVRSLFEFQKFIGNEKCEVIVLKYTPEEIKNLFNKIKETLKRNNIKCFNEKFIVKELGLDKEFERDLECIFDTFKDFYRISKALYYHSDTRPSNHQDCPSSKAIVSELLDVKDCTIDELKNELSKRGRVLQALTLRNILSNLKKR